MIYNSLLFHVTTCFYTHTRCQPHGHSRTVYGVFTFQVIITDRVQMSCSSEMIFSIIIFYPAIKNSFSQLLLGSRLSRTLLVFSAPFLHLCRFQNVVCGVTASASIVHIKGYSIHGYHYDAAFFRRLSNFSPATKRIGEIQ